ncbi:Exosome complex component rrp42 [Saitoella coloradoensis]
MPVTTGLSPAERSYLYTSLSQSIRPDFRSLTTFRPQSFQTDILPTANGSARVRWGGAVGAAVAGGVSGAGVGEVIVGVKAEIGPSQLFDDGSGTKGGVVNVNVEITPNADPNTTRDDDPLPTLLSTFLSQTLIPAAIPSTALTLGPERAWHIYIDCAILSTSGHPLPALSLAVRLAMMTTRLPRVTLTSDIDTEAAQVASTGGTNVREAVIDLDIDDDWDAALPIPGVENLGVVSIANVVGRTVFFDAAPGEEEVCDARVAVAVGADGDVVGVRMFGGAKGVGPEMVKEAVKAAQLVGVEVVKGSSHGLESSMDTGGFFAIM